MGDGDEVGLGRTVLGRTGRAAKQRRPRPTRLGLAGAVLLGAIACGGEGDGLERGDANENDERAADVATPAVTDPLGWAACESDGTFRCTTVEVPWDAAAPDGEQFALAVIRRPASDAEHRIGAVVALPGGPGNSGIDSLGVFVDALGSEITDRFDVVGFDQRGVGASGAFTCVDPAEHIFTVDVTPDDEAEIEAYLDLTRRQNEGCATDPHWRLFGSYDVARDVDRIREALGEETVTLAGYSYGTRTATAYADLFPDRVRALVLDGSVPPGTRQSDPRAGQAAGFDDALGRWITWCTANPERCPMADDPRAAVDQVIDTAEANPIPVPGGDPLPGWLAQIGVASAFYLEDQWSDLARALDAARSGDATPLAALEESIYPPEADGSPYSFDLPTAVSCADEAWRPTEAEIRAAAAEIDGGLDPDYAWTWSSLASCLGLESPSAPLAETPVPDTGPALVIANTGDPVTPYHWGQDLAALYGDVRLLTYEANRHTAALAGSSCVDTAVARFVVDLERPAANARCR